MSVTRIVNGGHRAIMGAREEGDIENRQPLMRGLEIHLEISE